MTWNEEGFIDERNCDFSDYYKDIGLYRAILVDKIVYVGKATELNNGGFRKRLRDYTRKSKSARNYPSGKLMNENSADLVIEISKFERSEINIQEINYQEKELIKLIQPEWNQLDVN